MNDPFQGAAAGDANRHHVAAASLRHEAILNNPIEPLGTHQLFQAVEQGLAPAPLLAPQRRQLRRRVVAHLAVVVEHRGDLFHQRSEVGHRGPDRRQRRQVLEAFQRTAQQLADARRAGRGQKILGGQHGAGHRGAFQNCLQRLRQRQAHGAVPSQQRAALVDTAVTASQLVEIIQRCQADHPLATHWRLATTGQRLDQDGEIKDAERLGGSNRTHG